MSRPRRRSRKGAEAVDESGEVALPADEVLDDLADVELSPAEASQEEADDQVGPIAEEVVDLEIED